MELAISSVDVVDRLRVVIYIRTAVIVSDVRV
jgi:hypothetical protein